MNWPVFRLDDVSEVAAGNPAPQEPTDFADDGFPFIRMQDVGREHHTSNLTDSTDKVSSGAISRYRLRLFPTGSVLIPKSGASVNLNHRAMLGDDAYVVSHLAVVVPKREKLLPEYLYFWSLAYDPRSQAQTTSLPSLPLSLIKAAQIPVPPLAEQRRIVDILSRAEGIVRLRREAQKKAAEIIPALFLDMFGDPATNPKGWPVVTLGSVISSIEFGISAALSKDAHYELGRVGVLRIANLTADGTLDLTDIRYLNASEKKKNQLLLRSGDLLFNWRNSPNWVGKTAIVQSDIDCIFASFLYRFRALEDQSDTIFIWFYMNFLRKRGFFESICRQAVSQANFGRDELAAIEVFLPPLQLQQAFAEKCQAIFSIQVQQATAKEKAEVTFEVLLWQMFNS